VLPQTGPRKFERAEPVILDLSQRATVVEVNVQREREPVQGDLEAFSEKATKVREHRDV
jgi:hypothetical protein